MGGMYMSGTFQPIMGGMYMGGTFQLLMEGANPLMVILSDLCYISITYPLYKTKSKIAIATQCPHLCELLQLEHQNFHVPEIPAAESLNLCVPRRLCTDAFLKTRASRTCQKGRTSICSFFHSSWMPWFLQWIPLQVVTPNGDRWEGNSRTEARWDAWEEMQSPCFHIHQIHLM